MATDNTGYTDKFPLVHRKRYVVELNTFQASLYQVHFTQNSLTVATPIKSDIQYPPSVGMCIV